jgi:peptide/nickel transport system substrate-binding protein
MRKISALALALAAALALSGCVPRDSGGENSGGETAAPPPPSETPRISPPPAVPEGDGRFSLRYDPASTLNPLTGTNADNLSLSHLMYESLFTLDSQLNYSASLCESFETEDCKIYDFTFREGAFMSDGAALSPYDVVYSINQARAGARYSSRLKNVVSASVIGPRTVRVTLSAPNARLPALLDFAIIKDGASGTSPRGTGPYRYSAAEGALGAMLVKNEYYQGAAAPPLDAIYLVSCSDSELGEYFNERRLDLLSEDPGAPRAAIHRDSEARYYNPTVLQYIGFNSKTAVISDVRFRRVAELAVDRETIAREYLGGHATASPLALPPYYRLYDTTWETAANKNAESDATTLISAALREIGMKDSDSDTFLEYPDNGDMIPFSIDFLVDSGNAARVKAAQSVATALRRVGLNIVLRELPFSELEKALKDGDFDMYLGETRLPADFDFSSLVSPGGALNLGNAGGEATEEKNANFLAARGDFNERNAARALCLSIAEDVTFIPIAYKQFAVYSGRGEISGLSPSQTSVFLNFPEWTVEADR